MEAFIGKKKPEKKDKKVMSDEEVVDMAEKVLQQMGLKDEEPVVEAALESPVIAKPEQLPEKDRVKPFVFNGEKYLKSQNTGIVYNLEHDASGKWDESAKQIIFYEEDEEEEGEEEEEEEYEE